MEQRPAAGTQVFPRQLVVAVLGADQVAGRLQLELEPTALDECVDDALEGMYRRVRESQATFKRADLPELECDRTLVRGIYIDLIDNAIRFAGDEPPRVEFTAEPDGDGWVLGVRDEGLGFDAAEVADVFAPFARPPAPGCVQGAGLGLAVAKRAVERHGGRIWIDSQPGAGTHVRFTLRG